jgi:autotransporter-associated beta strand protein
MHDALTTPLGGDLSWSGLRHSGTGDWIIDATPGARLTLATEGITMVPGGSKSLLIKANIVQNVAAVYAPTTSRNILIIGDLSGAGDITASGAGVLALNGNNTGYTGALAAFGTVIISAGSNTALGSEAVTLNQGTALNAGGASRTLANDVTLPGGPVKLEAVNATRNLVLNGVVSGAGAVNKIGAGAVTLNGANTYAGGTTVTAGALLVGNTTGSGTGPGAVTVSNPATTLGGQGGAIAGPATIGTQATLAPGLLGAYAGLLTFDDTLTFSSIDSKVTFDVATGTRGIDYDAVNVTGLLTYNGDFTLTINRLLANGTYDLFAPDGGAAGNFDTVSFASVAYTGTFSRSGNTWTAEAGGQTFSFDQLTGDLTVSAAPPEPSLYTP